jgi:hypothetical protein
LITVKSYKINYDPNYINNLLDTHVENFWKTYNIKIDFKLEIKNIFKKASYLMKSHYMFFMWNTQTSSWEYYHKIRGFKYDVEEKIPTSYLPFITLFMCKHG